MLVQIDTFSGKGQETVGYVKRDFVENSRIDKIGRLEDCEKQCSLEENKVYVNGECVGEIQVVSQEVVKILNPIRQCIGVVTVDNDSDEDEYPQDYQFEDEFSELVDDDNFSLTLLDTDPFLEDFSQICEELSLGWWGMNPLLWIKMIIQIQSLLMNSLIHAGVQAFFTFFHVMEVPSQQLLMSA